MDGRSARSLLLRRPRRHGDVPDGVRELVVAESAAGRGPVLGRELEEAVARPVRQDAEDLGEVRLGVEAVELAGGDQRKEALSALARRKLPVISSETMQLGSQWPFSSDDENVDGVIFRIRIKEKTGRYEESLNESSFGT